MRLDQLHAIVSPLPNVLANGQTADAVPLMADLNHIVNQVNANAAELATVALLAAANSFTQLQSGIAATNPANFPIASQVQNWAFNTLSSIAGSTTISGRVAELPLSAYARGQVFSFAPTLNNLSGNPTTININGVGDAEILSNGLGPPAAQYNTLGSGMLMAGQIHLLRYATAMDMQGTGFQLLNPSMSLEPDVPTLTFATPGNLVVAYSTRYGLACKLGKLNLLFFHIVTSTFTHTTASGKLQISGLSGNAGTGPSAFIGGLEWAGITKAGYTSIVPTVPASTLIDFSASGSGQALSDVTSADVPTGGTVRLRGYIIYPSNVS